MNANKAVAFEDADLFVSNDLLAIQLTDVFRTDEDINIQLLKAENVKLRSLWLNADAVANRLLGLISKEHLDEASSALDLLSSPDENERKAAAYHDALRLGFHPKHIDETSLSAD